jgi:hypothetical protein
VGLRLEALDLACTVAGVWIPLAARLTPANVSDIRIAPLLIGVLPEEARFVLGDKHYDSKDLRRRCLEEGRFLLSPKRGAYPHTDPGVEVRRIFHLLRHRAIENLNGHFSRPSSTARGRCPPRGLPTRRGSRWGRFSFTSWPCCTATKKGTWTPTRD